MQNADQPSFSLYLAENLFSLPPQPGNKSFIHQYSQKSSTLPFPFSSTGARPIFHLHRSSLRMPISIQLHPPNPSCIGSKSCETRHSRCTMTLYRCHLFLLSAAHRRHHLTALYVSRRVTSSHPLCSYGATVIHS